MLKQKNESYDDYVLRMQNRADILFPSMKDKNKAKKSKNLPLGKSIYDDDDDDDENELLSMNKVKSPLEVLKGDKYNKQSADKKDEKTLERKSRKDRTPEEEEADFAQGGVEAEPNEPAEAQGRRNGEKPKGFFEVERIALAESKIQDEILNEFYPSMKTKESGKTDKTGMKAPETAVPKGNNRPENAAKSDKIDNTAFSDAAWKKTRIFITGAEDFIPKAKRPLKDDKLTIGYGHTEGVKEGDTITREQAEELYKKDFKKYSEPLKHVKVPLNDNEKAALTSFIYNAGPSAFKNSTLLKKLNEGDRKGAAAEFDKWIYKNGRVEKGLINRRKKEKDLFLMPEEEI